MSRKVFAVSTLSLFLAFGVLHLVRLFFGWEARVAGVTIPMWMSWVAVIAMGILAWSAFVFWKREDEG